MAISDIHNYRQATPDLATSGQPREDQLAAIAAAGYGVVINLALHDDPRYSLKNEAASAQALGIEYVHIPVQFGAPTGHDLALFFDAMDRCKGRRLWIHCAANMRVTAFLGLYWQLREGWTEERAFSLMRDVWQPDEVWSSFIATQVANARAAKVGQPPSACVDCPAEPFRADIRWAPSMQSQTTPTFALVPADFDRLMKILRQRVRRGRRLPQVVFLVRLLSGVSIVAAAAIFVWLVQENEQLALPLETLIGLLFFAIAVALAAPHVSQALVRSRVVSQRGEFLAPRAIDFSESGLVIVSTLRRTEIRWEGVLAREEDSANYYLFIDEVQAVVIPRSSVAQFLPQFEQYTNHLELELT